MNRKCRFCKLFSIPAMTLIMLLLIAPLSIFADKTISNNLQGWSKGENKWVEGLLKGYTEQDRVPFRVDVTGYNGEEIKGLVIEHGSLSKKDHAGFQEAGNFKIVDITGGLPEPGDIIYESTAFVVTGPTSKTQPSGDEYIVYTIEITDAAVRDALKSKGSFAIYWEALLAIGSSKWPGATLQTSFPTGKETIPIKVSPLTADPSLKVTKSIDMETETYSAVGQVINYTITVENTGNVTLTDITVTDPTATITGGSPIASLAPGETATATASYTVTQADLDAGEITNTATASTVYNGETIADDDSITIPAVAGPFLKVTKSADVESCNEAGQVINYTITVENTGNVTLTDITVTDPTATITGGSPIASLAPGETATATASYTVTQADLDAGEITNTATASTVYDDETITDDDSVTIPAAAGPSLKVEKSSEGTYKEAGDLITYYVKVANTGNVTLTGIQVRDDMLGLNETIDSLAPGESRTFTGTYMVKESDFLEGNLVNTASALAVYNDEEIYDEDSVMLIPPEPPLVEPEYNVTTQPQPEKGGSTSGDGTYKQGTVITVEAVANSGYIFTGWYENDVKVSDSAEYQFTVSGDRHLVAHFQKEIIVQPEKPKTDPALPRTSGIAGALGLGMLLVAAGMVLRRFSR